LGDVFFHTLPHISSGDSHDHSSHDHSNHGSHDHKFHEGHSHMIIIAGIVSFFLIEKIVSNYLGGSGEHSHSHTHEKEQKVGKGKDTKP
jgi:zinc transporter ZupT